MISALYVHALATYVDAIIKAKSLGYAARLSIASYEDEKKFKAMQAQQQAQQAAQPDATQAQ